MPKDSQVSEQYLLHVAVAPVGSRGNDLHVLVTDFRLCKVGFDVSSIVRGIQILELSLTSNVIKMFLELPTYDYSA